MIRSGVVELHKNRTAERNNIISHTTKNRERSGPEFKQGVNTLSLRGPVSEATSSS